MLCYNGHTWWGSTVPYCQYRCDLLQQLNSKWYHFSSSLCARSMTSSLWCDTCGDDFIGGLVDDKEKGCPGGEPTVWLGMAESCKGKQAFPSCNEVLQLSNYDFQLSKRTYLDPTQVDEAVSWHYHDYSYLYNKIVQWKFDDHHCNRHHHHMW